MNEVNEEDLTYLESEADTVRSSLAQNALFEAILQRKRDRQPPEFSCTVKEFKVSNQRSSGRCWIFAAVNMLRIMMSYHADIPDSFEISQSYLFFYDKLERSSMFLTLIIRLHDVSLHDRLLSGLLRDPCPDGGHWCFAVHLIQKYGVVPKSVYGDTVSAERSALLNRVLAYVLRSAAERIRSTADVNAMLLIRRATMKHVYRLLCIVLGKPPSSFVHRFKPKEEKDKRACAWEKGKSYKVTPQTFMKYAIGVDLEKFTLLVDDPRFSPGTRYTIDLMTNMPRRTGVFTVVSSVDLMYYIVLSLKAKIPVWFTADIDRFFNVRDGVLDISEWKYDTILDTNMTGQSKRREIMYHASAPVHAMLVTGCNVVDGQVTMFRIENSWGSVGSQKGYLSATPQWMERCAYHAAIPTALLRPEHTVASDVIQLPSFDPMGTVAD